MTAAPAAREAWLDVARGYGILLVFYGHWLEPFADLRVPGAFASFKFVYAFHMPLFFVLAGWLAPESPRFGKALRRGLLARVLPAVVFNAIAILPWIPPSPLAATLPDGAITEGVLRVLQGRPNFNFLTWFLYCLFIVELLHVGLRRFARRPWAQGLAILAMLAAGQALAFRLDALSQATGLPKHLWYVDEALVAGAFHQLGFAAGQHFPRVRETLTGGISICLALAALGVTLMVFDDNAGPFTWYKPVVAMSMSSHGHPLWFPLGAIAGSVAILALARATPAFATAAWFGRHSLPLFGLNTLWITFVNAEIAVRIQPDLPRDPLAVGAGLAFGGALTLVLTAPLAWALLRYVPQLVGQPRAGGPWLPALLPPREAESPRGSG